MKKTQKVIDAIKYIEYLDLTTDEAERLLVEIEGLTFREEEKGEYEPDPYDDVARENCRAFSDNIL